MIIAGHTLAGACDEVPGHFHVATRFFTLFFMPVMPLQGWLVTSRQGTQFSGHLIPLSGKSLLLGYLRGALTVGGLICLGVGLYHVYLYFADGRPPILEALKFLGGWVLLWASAFASYYLGGKASYRRALQLGLVAGERPDAIAQLYQQPVPDEETLKRLWEGIQPRTEDGKPGLGPVGNFFTFLFFLAVAVPLLVWGGRSIVEQGYRGWWTCFLYGIAFFFGLLCLSGAGVTLLRLSNRTRDRLLLPILGLTLLVVGLGPWLSRWFWEAQLAPAMADYYSTSARSLEHSDPGENLGTITRAPYALHPLEFFLIDLMFNGKLHFAFKDEATQARWGDDPRYAAIQRLADQIKAIPHGEAYKKARADRLARLKQLLPQLRAGQWPDEVK